MAEAFPFGKDAGWHESAAKDKNMKMSVYRVVLGNYTMQTSCGSWKNHSIYIVEILILILQNMTLI